MLLRINYNNYFGKLKEKRVALFDSDAMDEKDVKHIIATDEYHKDVITMTEDQFKSVFRQQLAEGKK